MLRAATRTICSPARIGALSAVALYSSIAIASLNQLDPEADLLTRMADHPSRQLAELLPWQWTRLQPMAQAA